MIGRRRQFDAVIARPIVRAVTAAIVLISLGNTVALMCVVGWLRQVQPSESIRTALILFIAAATCQVAAATVALLAWAWAR